MTTSIITLDDKEPRTSGACAAVTFRNPAFITAMEVLFGVRESEKIVQFQVNELGIKVTIEQKQATKQL